MKHSFKITLYLIGLFIFAQLAGMVVLNEHIDKPVTMETGNVTFKPLPGIGAYHPERPEVEDKNLSFIPITIAILLGSGILLLMIKFNARRVWKAWFFVAITYTLFIALEPFIEKFIYWIFPMLRFYFMGFAEYLAMAICVVLGIFKVFRRNAYIHNFTELFIYGGLAAIFVDFLNLWSASILLILISIYDAIAVWQSKHMVKMARFQTKSKVFAGLFIPYSLKDTKNKERKLKDEYELPDLPEPIDSKLKVSKIKEKKNAILGGGDIGFPLLFAGAVMKAFGMGYAMIIILFSTIALSWLLFKAEQNKFYPAMPFISAGCFIGFGLVYLASIII